MDDKKLESLKVKVNEDYVLLACEALLGKDKSCLGYIKAYRHGKLETT